MTVSLYMDHHVPRAITIGLRRRGVNVITAFEDGSHELADNKLLDRATEMNCVLFTRDDDLLVEANKRQQANIPFAGVIYAHQLYVSIGVCVQNLEIMAKVGEPEDFANAVKYLPL